MLRVGIIGLGYWGPNLARNVAGCATTQVAALCDRDEARLDALSSQHPLAVLATEPEQLFSDPDIDAVAIATPVWTHFELARAALEAGKHVLVEKPFASSSDEAAELLALAEARGLVLMVDHVFLYSPPVRMLGSLVTSGELGDLLFIDSVRINLGLLQHDVNVMWDLAPHDLSIIDHLVGRSPLGVVASGISHAADGLASVAYLHLDYGSVLASVHVNWLSPVKIRHLLVGGSRRSVLYNDLDASEPVKVYDRGVDVTDDPDGRRRALISYRSGDVVSPNVDKSEPLQNMIKHFAGCIADGSSPVSDATQGLRVVQILEAADRSLAKGGTYVEIAKG
jgi:predicted dehydrogenase